MTEPVMSQPPMSQPMVLCATARLARGLREFHARTQLAQGRTQWQPLAALTAAQWLERLHEEAWLAGEIPPDEVPRLMLAPAQERILWERAIAAELRHEPAAALFDAAGLAQAAQEAHRLMVEWHVDAGSDQQTEETRQFLLWRERFRALCRKAGALDAASLAARQIDCVRQTAASLPTHVQVAGFDRLSPQETRLLEVLAARGVAVERLPLGRENAGRVSQASYDDAAAECRAAATWARQRLEADPAARLAIVAPELAAQRLRLAAILDDTLHPETRHAALAEAPRCYDFSLGAPLAEQPLAAAGLALLRLAGQRFRLPQQDISALLTGPYWSAAEREADARARLDARMRRKLPATVSLDQLLRLVRAAPGVPCLAEHLAAIEAAPWPKRALPSVWAAAFARTLQDAGWPGERGLSSHEYQARQAWDEALAAFAGLDAVLDELARPEALRQLSRLCRERIFQPEAALSARLQVMGMLEAAGEPLTAVWVMGMNDHLWPPPARPNPLLPAEAQRRARAPGSCAQVQAEFAAAVMQRLSHGAEGIVFSWARREGERELRASPLLAGMPWMENPPHPAATLAERLAGTPRLEILDDHRAPPVQAGEKVPGGAALLRAQAFCPAWAYYRYRLGARPLDEPAEGLDVMERGTLLHAVLQCFWQGRCLADLQAMDAEGQRLAIEAAVERGIAQFCAAQDRRLPPGFLALEKQRLHFLVAAWLALERSRADFTVQECERSVSLEIEGIAVDFTLDRVDALPDGRLVVIDYKTGAQVSHKSWAEARITEPQLPIYAALALADGDVAAVCFAKVRADEQKFVGIAHLSGTLPGVDCLEDARRLFSADTFPDWPSVLAHWQACIRAIAREIRDGEAPVRFADEADLRFCEVKPLLRLPERTLLFERSLQGAGDE